MQFVVAIMWLLSASVLVLAIDHTLVRPRQDIAPPTSECAHCCARFASVPQLIQQERTMFLAAPGGQGLGCVDPDCHGPADVAHVEADVVADEDSRTLILRVLLAVGMCIALLFALPAMRNIQPGIPPVGILIDIGEQRCNWTAPPPRPFPTRPSWHQMRDTSCRCPCLRPCLLPRFSASQGDSFSICSLFLSRYCFFWPTLSASTRPAVGHSPGQFPAAARLLASLLACWELRMFLHSRVGKRLNDCNDLTTGCIRTSWRCPRRVIIWRHIVHSAWCGH